ncbi:O-antigen polysaccharide polymerase Wzy [Planctomycetota bacterium]|nr:O-antigen polysaccharide polymerase Wzy [Planctomycetota bacterium]
MGLGLFAWSLVRTFVSTEEHFPMVPLTVLLASTQWCLMPAIAYWIDFRHFKMGMSCSEDVYMPIACGGLMAYALGLSIGAPRRRTESVQEAVEALRLFFLQRPNSVPVLLGISVVSLAALPFTPGVLQFPVVLLAQTRFAAVLALIVTRRRLVTPVILVVMAFEAWSSTRTGMFHDLILWSAILGIAYMHSFQIRPPIRILILGAGVLLVASLQIVKGDFREGAWAGSVDQGLEFAMTRGDSAFSSTSTFLNELEAQLPRFNQGWIISAAISFTPKYRPFLHGESVQAAVEGALLPRILSSNKVKAGTTDLIESTTGIAISEGTSMGLSPVGESYVNFGAVGGAAFMLLLGLIYSGAFRALRSLSARRPLLLVFIPGTLQYVMRAEGELAGGLNHLTKALIVYIALTFVLTRVDLGLGTRRRAVATAGPTPPAS